LEWDIAEESEKSCFVLFERRDNANIYQVNTAPPQTRANG
jgi:hypothetical protein